MPLAPSIAAALSAGLPARTFALWVDGVDWLKQPGLAANRYGVPIESIEVTENGPGGVSSLSFSLEDSLNQVSLPPAGSEILFMDLTDDHPEFLGYVQVIDVRPHEGQQGRWLDVTAIGIECLLDWEIIPSLTVDMLAGSQPAFQAAAAGTQLRAFRQGGGPGGGNQAFPIASDAGGAGVNLLTLTAMTLRNAILRIWAEADNNPTIAPDGLQVTVDFTRGLRVYPRTPDDYVGLTVNDTAFTNTSAQLHYTLTPADVVRSVFIVGGGGYTGTFSDGSGIVGQGAVLNDSTITTALQGEQAARDYLGTFAQQLRGTLHLNTFSHGTTKYQAGSYLTLTNDEAGLAAEQFTIGSIRKRYNSNGSEEWTISFGGLVPSATRMIRRQTRDTLS